MIVFLSTAAIVCSELLKFYYKKYFIQIEPDDCLMSFTICYLSCPHFVFVCV